MHNGKFYPLCFSERVGPGELPIKFFNQNIDNFMSYGPLQNAVFRFGGKMEGINITHF